MKKDSLQICAKCGGDACYVTPINAEYNNYFCFGCGFQTNDFISALFNYRQAQTLEKDNLYSLFNQSKCLYYLERYDEASTRFGNGFVRATYKAGDNGTDYAIAIEVSTTLGQLYQIRAILRVKNLLP